MTPVLPAALTHATYPKDDESSQEDVLSCSSTRDDDTLRSSPASDSVADLSSLYPELMH